MPFRWNSSSHPISDLRDWSKRQKIEIKPPFQRHSVWSLAANIMLMDTILRNIPMPKVFFLAVIRDSETYRIVIDGQQRIKAILAFMNDGFKLTEPYSGEYAGLTFSELPDDVRDDFLAYKIDINEIVNANDEIVREIYSRVNKYTVALSKQELRRADFPGRFLYLSEKLSVHEFFDRSKIFTVSNRRRMADVEFTSELLAVLLDGIQDKRDKLDDFYQKYAEWNEQEEQRTESSFKDILSDIDALFDNTQFPLHRTRFKQKADFYSMFSAINGLHSDGWRLEGKDLQHLCTDLRELDALIEPESPINVLAEYAIKCVSQGNTIGSRRWRAEFLRNLFSGTYAGEIPSKSVRDQFHIICAKCVSGDSTPTSCPVCNERVNDLSPSSVFLTWKATETVFQMSNSVFVHTDCIPRATDVHTFEQ